MIQAMKVQTLWKLVSQVNLEEISDEIERPFHLLIVSTSDAGERLGAALSDEAGSFVHPWISVETPPLSLSNRGTERVDLAIVVSEAVDLDAEHMAALRTLEERQVANLVLIHGEAGLSPGAEIARRGERARVGIGEIGFGELVEKLAPMLLDVAPSHVRLSMARRLPALRAAAFQQLIREASQANATYSFTTGLAETIPVLDIPLNVGDLIVLSKNQLMMAYKIALVAGKEGTPQKLLGEIVGVLGGGFIFRQISRQLVGLIPVWGILPKTAVAYAGTWSIGQATVLWAVEGQRITPELLSGFYSEAFERGQTIARQIAERMRGQIAPGSATIEGRIVEPDGGEESNGASVWQRLRKRLPDFSRGDEDPQ